jgi:polyphenol oxidase
MSGAAFSTAADGDLKSDEVARQVYAVRLGISGDWATVSQVHGANVVEVDRPGNAGEADALFTTRRRLPVAVFTADCFAVALIGPDGIGMAHAGWRGATKGVVAALRSEMQKAGVSPERAYIGPGIQSCCFEVGPEVLSRFEGYTSTTTWGTTSVDIKAAVRDQLAGLDVDASDACTRCGSGHFSYRRDATTERMAGVAWLE